MSQTLKTQKKKKKKRQINIYHSHSLKNTHYLEKILNTHQTDQIKEKKRKEKDNDIKRIMIIKYSSIL